MTHTHHLIGAIISVKTSQEKNKTKQRKNRNYSSLFISKWTMKHIVSLPLTPRATAHNNNNVLTWTILEHNTPFKGNLTMHIMHAMQFWPGVKHSTNNGSSVRSP